MFTNEKAYAIQKRSEKIAQELLEDGIDGWMTALAVVGWLLGTMPKNIADKLTEDMKDDLRKFPTYPGN